MEPPAGPPPPPCALLKHYISYKLSKVLLNLKTNDSKFVIFASWSFLYLAAKAGLLLKEVLLVPPFYIFFLYFRAECDSLKGFPILKIKFS